MDGRVSTRPFCIPPMTSVFMRHWATFCTTLTLAAALSLPACGSETGAGGGDLSDDEIAALVEALTTAGIPMGADQFLLGPLLGGTELGTLGSGDAFGVQVDVTVLTGAGADSYRWIGVVGWSGFEAGAESVDEAFGAMYLFSGASFPSSFDEDLENGNVLAWAYRADPRTNYYPGETGQFSLASSSFAAASDCEYAPALPSGVELVECLVSFGSMAGNLGFTADRISGTGPASFAFPATAYDLPAARLEIRLDYTAAAPALRSAREGPILVATDSVRTR